MDTTSRYPSSAELAAFRRRLRVALPPTQRFARNHPDEHTVGPHPDHAWAEERRVGIGFSAIPGRSGHVSFWSRPDVAARREAAAMRSRAYDDLLEAAADSLSWCDSEQSYRDTLDAYALDTFAPRRTAAVPA